MGGLRGGVGVPSGDIGEIDCLGPGEKYAFFHILGKKMTQISCLELN